MAKRIIAKKWTHLSTLGECVFYGVPIFVEDIFPGASGATAAVKKGDLKVIGPAGDVINIMEREVAKQWVIQFVEQGRNSASITAEEVHGILLVLGISKTEFAKLLKVDKGTVTKYVGGTLKPPAPVTQLMLIYLSAELTKAGTAQALVQGSRSLINITLTVPVPKFTIKKAA